MSKKTNLPSLSPAQAASAWWNLIRQTKKHETSISRQSRRYLRHRHLEPALAFFLCAIITPKAKLNLLSWWAQRGYTIVSPLYDLLGHIRSLMTRRITGGKPKTRFPGGVSLRGQFLANTAARRLLFMPETKAPVLLAEGMTDFLALASHVPDVPFIGAPNLRTAPTFIDSWVENRNIYVAFDNDDVGQRAATELAPHILDHGGVPIRLCPSDHNTTDMCDTLHAIGPDKFRTEVQQVMKDHCVSF